VKIRAYGQLGDRKTDGLYWAEGVFFQVYSPDDMQLAKAKKKIDTDLEGAIEHWKDQLKEWVFVYNDHRGIAADIEKLLQEKRSKHPQIAIDQWGPDRLWEMHVALHYNNGPRYLEHLLVTNICFWPCHCAR
jgi:hypothetical protein